MFYIKNNRTSNNYTNFFSLVYSSPAFNDALIIEAQASGDNNGLAITASGRTVTDSTVNFRNGNTWQHVCVVYVIGVSSSVVKYYLNGTFKSQGSNSATNASTARQFFIGRATWDANQFIQGQMRGFRMYGRELNASEIMACYTND